MHRCREQTAQIAYCFFACMICNLHIILLLSSLIIPPGAVAGAVVVRHETAADHPALHLHHGGLQTLKLGGGHLEDVVRRCAEADTWPLVACWDRCHLCLHLLSLLCFVDYRWCWWLSHVAINSLLLCVTSYIYMRQNVEKRERRKKKGQRISFCSSWLRNSSTYAKSARGSSLVVYPLLASAYSFIVHLCQRLNLYVLQRTTYMLPTFNSMKCKVCVRLLFLKFWCSKQGMSSLTLQMYSIE